MFTNVLRVRHVVVLVAHTTSLIAHEGDLGGGSAGLGEEVAELALELVGVIELGCGLGALEVEPEDAVHDATVREHLVSHGLLQQAVHVVLFKS